MVPVSSDDARTRPLAEDPGFLASLAELDRGLGDAETHVARPSGPPPVRSTPLGPVVAPAAPGQRPLLDLFPVAGPQRTAAAPSPVFGEAARTPAPVRPSEPRDARQAVPSAKEASPTYETFYGLHERPFGPSSDLKFLYHGNEHDRVTQLMLGAIGRREPIVTLTGDLGAGKTTLCRALVEQLDRRTLTSFVSEPFTSAADLLATLLVDFGVISSRDAAGGRLADATTAELTGTLRDFLTSLLTLQAFAVVIVDEAQNLTPDQLEDLRTIAAVGGDEPLLQVVLVGQPGLTALIARPALRELSRRVALSARLGPLAADEIGGYVMHRLRVAGDHPRVEIDEAAVAKVHALTGGLPRTVNLLLDRALEAGFSKSASVIDETLIDGAAVDLDLAPPSETALRAAAVIGLLAFLLLAGAAGGAYVFRSDIAALVIQWQNVPLPPRRPALAQPAPYRPPVPAEIALEGKENTP